MGHKAKTGCGDLVQYHMNWSYGEDRPGSKVLVEEAVKTSSTHYQGTVLLTKLLFLNIFYPQTNQHNMVIWPYVWIQAKYMEMAWPC